MPVRRVKGGFRFGTKGKTYPTRAQAVRQGRAIKAAQQARKHSAKS